MDDNNGYKPLYIIEDDLEQDNSATKALNDLVRKEADREMKIIDRVYINFLKESKIHPLDVGLVIDRSGLNKTTYYFINKNTHENTKEKTPRMAA